MRFPWFCRYWREKAFFYNAERLAQREEYYKALDLNEELAATVRSQQETIRVLEERNKELQDGNLRLKAYIADH